MKDFDAITSVKSWLQSANKRHLGGHKLTGPRGPQAKMIKERQRDHELDELEKTAVAQIINVG